MYNLDIETNVISIFMLFTIYFSLHKQVNKQEFINRLFITLVWLNILILIIDSFQVFFDGVNTTLGSYALQISTGVYYFLNPIIPLFWLIYVDFHIFRNRKRLFHIFYISLPILLLHTTFIIMSISSDFIYRIDSVNNYFRGQYFWVSPVISFSFVAVSTAFILVFRKKIKKNEFLPLLLFALPPVIASVFQISMPGVTIIWPSMTISIMIVYIHIQSRLTTTDYLTGLFNRREYENQLSLLEKNKGKNFKMGGIVCDIDDFKDINDNFGHHVGDEALIVLGNILKDIVRKDDFVARLGGDEFSIVIMDQDNKSLKDIVDRIEDKLRIFNQTEDHLYQIKISVGYDVYQAETYETIEKFFIHLDHKMYEAKKINKHIK
ncbi:MAG: GGDEF domain-containing protein [Acholeplasmataceae bacterium]|nr:GGDEF domain-containing protein [Acholeplasmataceae bacterium]